MAGSANCKLVREMNVELVSLRLFNQADEAGVLITRRYVQDRLNELATHPDTCRCNSLCRLARKVNAASVFRCAAAWQRQVNITRKLAAR